MSKSKDIDDLSRNAPSAPESHPYRFAEEPLHIRSARLGLRPKLQKLPLAPALRSWIDNVIVPALVDVYLREQPPTSTAADVESIRRAA